MYLVLLPSCPCVCVMWLVETVALTTFPEQDQLSVFLDLICPSILIYKNMSLTEFHKFIFRFCFNFSNIMWWPGDARMWQFSNLISYTHMLLKMWQLTTSIRLYNCRKWKWICKLGLQLKFIFSNVLSFSSDYQIPLSFIGNECNASR